MRPEASGRGVLPQGAPWYTQFWPWFLIAIPAASVVAGIATLVVAFRNADTLVHDDYYRAGLAINQDFAREREASRLSLSATLNVDPEGGRISVVLDGSDLKSLDEVVLDLSHPTHGERDQSLVLRRSSAGDYTATLAAPLQGPWYTSLQPRNGTWRLLSRLDFSARGPLRLVPRR